MLVARRLLALADGLQAFLQPARHPTPGITISDEWHALGPFTIGTREAAWSSDPLEHYGGFRALRVDDAKRFASALMPNGTTAWSAVAANVTYPQHGQGDVTATVSVSYPAVDWDFLRQVYGWAAVQWQGWVRGHIHVNTQGYQLVNIYLNQVFELWIDDDHYYGGDFYGFGKVPLTVRLESGTHQVDIRLIRDTRAMGGLTKEPAIEVSLLLQVVDAQLARWGYIDVLYSDWNGTHLSTLASGVYHNTGDEDAYIVDILAAYPRHCTAVLISQDPIRLLPHQSRPVASRILCEGPDDADTVILHFTYQTAGEERVLMDGAELRPPVPMHEPRVITYLHPAGFVSSAILRPPPASHVGNDSLPVLLVLHGAGVDINSEQAKHSIDGVADLAAWILMPSGSTAWSGDDWHSWGWADVEAALVSVPVWIEQNGWQGPGVDLARCLVTGHSNGGQGVWYALTHHPDRFLAAAPVSGYSSIQNYVPYTFWHPAEPAQETVLQAQLSAYRHELLLSNTKGIPILQQHGSADDNVPAYHSRLMHDLLVREGSRSNYSEFSGMPHWWDNVMTTEPLRTFYKHHLTHGRPLVEDFTLVVADPGSIGSKGGITVLEKTPDLLSYVQVWIRDGSAHLSTSNVGALHLDTGFMYRCVKLTVDDQDIILPPPMAGHAITLVKSQHQTWKISTDRSDGRRQAGQYGGLEAILRTNGSFQIVQHSAGTSRHAVQAANSLLQYFDADVAVAESYDQALEQPGNIISFAVGADLLRSSSSSTGRCHIRLTMNSTLAFVREGEVLRHLKIGNDHVVAAAFLQPLPQGRLELILWAIDDAALDVAARFVPLLTGSGFPDFIFATRAMLSRGLAGVTGIGFLDAFWCPTSNSYFSMRDTQTGKTSV